MYFFMTVTTKGNKAIEMLKLMPDNRLPVNPICFVVNLKIVIFAAHLAFVPISDTNPSFRFLPIGIIPKCSHIVGLPAFFMLQSTHQPPILYLRLGNIPRPTRLIVHLHHQSDAPLQDIQDRTNQASLSGYGLPVPIKSVYPN